MIVFEKLRAICQQMPEYRQEVPDPSQSGRARDFFDIHAVLTSFRIDLLTAGNADLLRNIFTSKRVPLRLIGLIPNYREYHRQDFRSVESTVKPGVAVRDFDFYFDYVVEHCCTPLKPLWEE